MRTFDCALVDRCEQFDHAQDAYDVAVDRVYTDRMRFITCGCMSCALMSITHRATRFAILVPDGNIRLANEDTISVAD